MNLGELLDRVESKRLAGKASMVVFVSPLSEKARLRLLERLTNVRDGYKKLQKECK